MNCMRLGRSAREHAGGGSTDKRLTAMERTGFSLAEGDPACTPARSAATRAGSPREIDSQAGWSSVGGRRDGTEDGSQYGRRRTSEGPRPAEPARVWAISRGSGRRRSPGPGVGGPGVGGAGRGRGRAWAGAGACAGPGRTWAGRGVGRAGGSALGRVSGRSRGRGRGRGRRGRGRGREGGPGPRGGGGPAGGAFRPRW